MWVWELTMIVLNIPDSIDLCLRLNMRYLHEVGERNPTSDIFNLTTTNLHQGICGPQISGRTPAIVVHIEQSQTMSMVSDTWTDYWLKSHSSCEINLTAYGRWHSRYIQAWSTSLWRHLMQEENMLQIGLVSTLGVFLFPFTSCFLFELNLCTSVLTAIQHCHHAYLVSLTQ